MEKDFFELYESQSLLVIEVGHNSVADWNIVIYDRKGKKLKECNEPDIHVSGNHRELVFAEAYLKLSEYLSENRGGY